jgi:hypothetical protein
MVPDLQAPFAAVVEGVFLLLRDNQPANVSNFILSSCRSASDPLPDTVR